jgi:hypothetical protein
MKYSLVVFMTVMLVFSACQRSNEASIVDMEKVYAWCIVPFDSLKRSPEERLSMLKRLGIKKYAYDWRQEHLASTANELRLARKNNIEVNALWLWIDNDWDAVGRLNDANERLFRIIEEVTYQGQIWVSFNSNFFENLPDQEAVKKGAEMIAFLSRKANALGCKIALYNHGDWFGEPENQIKIMNALPDEDLGIIFNFHHAHDQIDRFPEMVDMMLPYLWSVNLNGMRKEGPKILPIGQGDHEQEMINLLIKKGYTGDFGILGHVEEADVEMILKANLEGLKN